MTPAEATAPQCAGCARRRHYFWWVKRLKASGWNTAAGPTVDGFNAGGPKILDWPPAEDAASEVDSDPECELYYSDEDRFDDAAPAADGDAAPPAEKGEEGVLAAAEPTARSRSSILPPPVVVAPPVSSHSLVPRAHAETEAGSESTPVAQAEAARRGGFRRGAVCFFQRSWQRRRGRRLCRPG